MSCVKKVCFRLCIDLHTVAWTSVSLRKYLFSFRLAVQLRNVRIEVHKKSILCLWRISYILHLLVIWTVFTVPYTILILKNSGRTFNDWQLCICHSALFTNGKNLNIGVLLVSFLLAKRLSVFIENDFRFLKTIGSTFQSF